MSTSGSTNFNLNRNQIIAIAFQHLNVYTEGDTISNGDNQFASNLLNMMIKAWQTQGHLWLKTEATLFPIIEQAAYSLNASGANCTDSYVDTTLNADAAAAATSLTLTSSSGMTVGDYIGIVLDTDALQWTTIATIPDSTHVTIATGLTSEATSGNAVYAYTTKIDRPLNIMSVRRNQNDIDTPMLRLSRQEYFDLPNKNSTTSSSTPTSWYYDPQLSAGVLYLWPTNSTAAQIIKFTYQRPIDDFDAAVNDPDFPTEWLEVIAMQLAVRLSYRYGKRNQIQALKADADAMLEGLKDFDNEEGSIYFQPSSM